jgi:hypothetical protein
VFLCSLWNLLTCNLLLRATRTPRCAGERTRVVLGLTKHGLQNEIMTESVRRDEEFSCHVFPYSKFTDFLIAGTRVRAWILAAILCVQWFTVIRTVFRSPSVATFLTQNRAGIGRPGQVHGPNARPFSGLKAPHEPRSSRREEARSFSHAGSQSLLTPAATVQGFNARSFVSEKFNG